MNSAIPEEIVTEIFSWLPVKSLIRLKCVTKFANSLVSELEFTDTHRCRSMIRPGGKKLVLHGWKKYYIADQQKEDGKISASIVQTHSFDELPFNIPYLNCVNDLVCIWQRLSNKPAAILNPSTREVRFLPKLNDDFSLQHCSLGFEPEENKYKILATTNHVRETYTKYWIFTLGIDESWREAKSPSHILCIPGVHINGVIYKFFYPYELAIAGFDVKTEIFNITVFMYDPSPSRHYELIEVKGKLAVIDYEKSSDEYINLRVLDRSGEEEWKHHIIKFPSTWKDIQREVILSYTSCDGEILFMANIKSGTLCRCYDVTRQSWREIEIKGLPKGSYIRSIYSYVERLVM